MGKYLIGLFFVIIAAFLTFMLWNGSVKEQMDFEADVKGDIETMYKDPHTVKPIGIK